MVYVGHLPRGLCEPQLRQYFEQFGTVRRLRLSRSKKVRRASRAPQPPRPSAPRGELGCNFLSEQREAPCYTCLRNKGLKCNLRVQTQGCVRTTAEPSQRLLT